MDGVTVNVPAHCVRLIAFTFGIGYTFTITVNVPLTEQEDILGVTTYVAVAIKLPVADKVPVITSVGVP